MQKKIYFVNILILKHFYHSFYHIEFQRVKLPELEQQAFFKPEINFYLCPRNNLELHKFYAFIQVLNQWKVSKYQYKSNCWQILS